MCLLGLSLSAQILLNCLYIADILTLHPQYTGDTPVSICKEQECSPAQPQCIIIPEKLKSDPVVLPNIQSISKLLGLFQGVLNRCFFYFLFFFKPAPDSNQGSSYAFGGKSPWRSFFFFFWSVLFALVWYIMHSLKTFLVALHIWSSRATPRGLLAWGNGTSWGAFLKSFA